MVNKFSTGVQQPHLFAAEAESTTDPIPPTHKIVFSTSADRSAVGITARGRNSETNSRMSEIMRALRSSGMSRPSVQPDVQWKSMLDALEQEMPNFARVIQAVIRPHVYLASMGVDHRMPPTLLLGEPGVGKTRFARAIAKILGLPKPLHIQMAAETNGATLAGSSTFWSNSSPGLLFEALAWGTGTGAMAANPLVLLDELDKPHSELSYDPLGPLYSLLEADTAKEFQDQAMPDLHIDTSSVRWIATANDVSSIPEPLRSRMCIFEIPMPTQTQQRAITQKVYQDLLARYHLPLADHLPASVLDELTALPPREAKLALDCAIASAVARQSNEVQLRDLVAVISRPRKGLRSRIGFQ